MSEPALTKTAAEILSSTSRMAADRGLAEYETEELLAELSQAEAVRRVLEILLFDPLSRRIAHEAVRRLGDWSKGTYKPVTPQPSPVCLEIMGLAQSAARETGTDRVSSVHLLLGLFEAKRGPNVGKQVLGEFDLTASKLRELLERRTASIPGEE